MFSSHFQCLFVLIDGFTHATDVSRRHGLSAAYMDG